MKILPLLVALALGSIAATAQAKQVTFINETGYRIKRSSIRPWEVEESKEKYQQKYPETAVALTITLEDQSSFVLQPGESIKKQLPNPIDQFKIEAASSKTTKSLVFGQLNCPLEQADIEYDTIRFRVDDKKRLYVYAEGYDQPWYWDDAYLKIQLRTYCSQQDAPKNKFKTTKHIPAA